MQIKAIQNFQGVVHMKRFTIFIFSVILLTLQSICFAGIRDYPRVAVLEFSNDSMVADMTVNDTKSVTDRMVEALVDCERFNVMERRQLKALADEHHLNMTGLIDPASAAQIGRMLGVQYLVFGNIAAVSNKESEVGYTHSTGGSASNQQHQVFASVTARFVEVETGRIVLAAHGFGRSTSTKTEIAFNQRKHNRYQTTATDPVTGLEDVAEADDVTTSTHTIKLGSETFSSVQVHNALYKAIVDLVEGKSGFVAKLDGKAKKRKI